MINKDNMPICEAANYFKEEILEIMPDISIAQLADMVSLYIYYQYGITKEEAKKVIETTCLWKLQEFQEEGITQQLNHNFRISICNEWRQVEQEQVLIILSGCYWFQ